MLFLATTLDGLQMGLCFAVLALGVYISCSILDFADLSVDGVFPLGGVCCTIMMLRLGLPALPAVLLCFPLGMLCGTVTGVLHVKFRISNLLSGIIVMTALLSVTLALTQFLTGTGYTTTIFSFRSADLTGLFNGALTSALTDRFGRGAKDYITIVILLVIVFIAKLLLDLFFKTRLGYLLRATGSNEKLVMTLGKNSGSYKIFGLALADGFVAVSGALYAQLYTQYDNTCGSGKVVLALASVIIGTAVFAHFRRMKDTTAVILGAILYSLCLNYLVLIDTNGIYLKLLNAVLFALILIFNEKISAFLSRIRRKKEQMQHG